MTHILSSPSGTFCLTCLKDLDSTPLLQASLFLSGKVMAEILIAVNGSPRSLTMQADENCAPSPYCPCLVRFSCLSLCSGSHHVAQPPTTAAHPPFSRLALFLPYFSPLHKPFHSLILSFCPHFPDEAHVSSKPSSDPNFSPKPSETHLV